VLINSLFAEILTNMHSFLVIGPNHAGDDVMMFEDKAKGKGEFYLRQIVGSVNYPTGTNTLDFFHGWLNYQIEHHLWPDMPLSQYQKLQPQVEAVCKKHNIPYLQDSVFKRMLKAADIMVGKTSMLKPAAV
jgi:fatty acid desaturase